MVKYTNIGINSSILQKTANSVSYHLGICFWAFQ